MKTSKTLYLVRHGTVHNPERIVYRRLPGYRLSETGQEEARFAARQLRQESFDVIFRSPLERAEETARIINETHRATVIVDDRLHEWGEEESPDSVAERMESFLTDWVNSEFDVGVAVSHRDPIRALLHRLDSTCFLDARDGEPPYVLPPCGIYKLASEFGRTTYQFVCTPGDNP